MVICCDSELDTEVSRRPVEVKDHIALCDEIHCVRGVTRVERSADADHARTARGRQQRGKLLASVRGRLTFAGRSLRISGLAAVVSRCLAEQEVIGERNGRRNSSDPKDERTQGNHYAGTPKDPELSHGSRLRDGHSPRSDLCAYCE